MIARAEFALRPAALLRLALIELLRRRPQAVRLVAKGGVR